MPRSQVAITGVAHLSGESACNVIPCGVFSPRYLQMVVRGEVVHWAASFSLNGRNLAPLRTFGEVASPLTHVCSPYDITYGHRSHRCEVCGRQWRLVGPNPWWRYRVDPFVPKMPGGTGDHGLHWFDDAPVIAPLSESEILSRRSARLAKLAQIESERAYRFNEALAGFDWWHKVAGGGQAFRYRVRRVGGSGRSGTNSQASDRDTSHRAGFALTSESIFGKL